jgi:hypothetical protein
MINNFETSIVLGEGVKSVTVKFVTDSFFINGNIVEKDGEKELVKEVTNEYKITDDAVINASVENGVLTVNGNEQDVKVKPVGAVGAKISFEVELEEGKETADVKINYIDQNVGVDGYKQDFKLDADGKLTAALPRVALNDEVYSREYANKPVFIVNKEKSLSFNVYSVLGNVKASDVYLEKVDSDAVIDTSSEKAKWIMFGQAGEKTIKLVCKNGDDVKLLETINATAVVDGTDTDVPVYTYNEDALNAFKFALEKAYTKEDHSLYLGATLQIPSLEDLVSDNTIPYSDLKTTVYYKTPTTTSTSSSMSFKLDVAGTYTFFVAFSDGANAMKEEDFMKVDGDTVTYNEDYKCYIFTFSIADDAPMTVSAPTAGGVAYRGVSYTSASFKLDADGFNTEYTLYYNASKTATADDDGWVKIPKASTVKEGYSDENGNTYASVKAINYDGKLSFKPTKIGSYKIVCNVSSSYTTRTAEANTIVRVTSDPVTVKVPSTWLQDNVWSVVFLSIGTLCLAGIIVLLCIKPKDENNAD